MASGRATPQAMSPTSTPQKTSPAPDVSRTSTGGASMASEYNARPLVPEVLVKGDRFEVVRPRPSYDDMLAREPMADWL